MIIAELSLSYCEKHPGKRFIECGCVLKPLDRRPLKVALEPVKRATIRAFRTLDRRQG